MSRSLSRPAAWLVVALAAGLLALPACKKKQPTKPDSTPEPNQNENTGPGPGTTNQPSDPNLPSALQRRPLFSTTAAAPLRQRSENNLKQISLAFHNFNDTLGAFPAGIAGKDGKVGLSWRVAILPFIEYEALYKQFKLDEPWDSEHNKALIPQMPKTYAPPNTDTNGYTFYRSFSGQGTVLQPSGAPTRPGQPVLGAKLFAIPDGTANTFLVAEAYDPVIWTKPDDLPFTPGKPPRLGGGVFGNGFCVAFCDGSVRFMPMGIDPQTLSDAIQINDGRIVNLP